MLTVLPFPALPSPSQPDGADQLLADLLHLLPVQRGLPEHALPDDPVALVREAALQPRNRGESLQKTLFQHI